jgi:hypothetical protein
MTFRERYRKEDTWHGRVVIMEIYHLTMLHQDGNWTVSKSADYFGCSLGLMSENLKIAHALHSDSILIQCPSRQDALKRLNGHSYRKSGGW